MMSCVQLVKFSNEKIICTFIYYQNISWKRGSHCRFKDFNLISLMSSSFFVVFFFQSSPTHMRWFLCDWCVEGILHKAWRHALHRKLWNYENWLRIEDDIKLFGIIPANRCRSHFVMVSAGTGGICAHSITFLLLTYSQRQICLYVIHLF